MAPTMQAESVTSFLRERRVSPISNRRRNSALRSISAALDRSAALYENLLYGSPELNDTEIPQYSKMRLSGSNLRMSNPRFHQAPALRSFGIVRTVFLTSTPIRMPA